MLRRDYARSCRTLLAAALSSSITTPAHDAAWSSVTSRPTWRIPLQPTRMSWWLMSRAFRSWRSPNSSPAGADRDLPRRAKATVRRAPGRVPRPARSVAGVPPAARGREATVAAIRPAVGCRSRRVSRPSC